MKRLLILAILVQLFRDVHCAKVVMASLQIRSHILEQLSLAEELASRGHEVYIAVGSRFPNRTNFEKPGIKTLPYKIPDDVLYGVSEEFEKIMVNTTFHGGVGSSSLLDHLLVKLAYRDCAYMMEDASFLEQVRRLDLDLAIVEPFLLSFCNLILPKYLDIPFVSMTTFFNWWQIRVPVLPSFFSVMSLWTDATEITFLRRLENFVNSVSYSNYLAKIAPENSTLLERFAPGLQSWYELYRLSELFLVEVDHHLEGAVPMMPNVISVAGLTTRKAKALPAGLKEVIQNSTDGIILLSLGSVAYYFPDEAIVKFLEAFSKLNETVLVKFFIPEGVKVPENVKIFSWLPQNDVLGHPKTKLFITHCGNNGQHEALYHGVPMIGFPLFAEQHDNCDRADKKGFGIMMNILTFTPDELFIKIKEVLNNPKYRSTIRKASEIFRDQPLHPRERGAFWVEHVIKHGGKHLRPLSLDMSLYQFFMLDVIGILCIVACIFYILFRLIVKRCYHFCCQSKMQNFDKIKSE